MTEVSNKINNKTIIAIIVPVYNVEPYIRRCVNSILNQSFPFFKLILVDDGSYDKSGIICDEYAKNDSRVIVIHKENGGQSSARNSAIRYIQNELNVEFITFIDSDDWVSVDYIETLYNLIKINGVYISVCEYCAIKNTDEVPPQASKEIMPIEIGEPESIWINKLKGTGYIWGKLFPISLFTDFMFTEGKIYEDVASLHILLFQAPQIAYTPFQKYYYYINQNSTTGGIWTPKRIDELWAQEQQLHFFRKNQYKKAYAIVMKQHVSTIAQSIDKSAPFKELRKKRIILRLKLKYYVIFKKKYIKNNKYRNDYYIKNAFPISFPIYKRIKKAKTNLKERYRHQQ